MSGFSQRAAACCLALAAACRVVLADDGSAADRAVVGEVETLFSQKQYSAVIELFARMPDEQRRRLPAKTSYWLGLSQFETGEWAVAEWHLLRASTEVDEPEIKFAALTRLAQIACRLGQFERAISQLVLALDNAPTETEFQRALVLIGDVHQQQGDFDAARRAYVEVLEVYPALHGARLKMLWAIYRAERFEECIAASTEAMTQLPVQERMELTYLLAASQRRLKHYPKAIELYEQLLQTFPFGRLAGDARHELALSHLEKGDPRTAARQAEAALRAHPSRADRLRYLWIIADAQAQLSQWQTAKDVYREIAETGADTETVSRALRAMIKMATKQGRADEAAELSRLLRDRQPGPGRRP